MPLRAIIAACALLAFVAKAEAEDRSACDTDFLDRVYAISKFNSHLNLIAATKFSDNHMNSVANALFKKNNVRMKRIFMIAKEENLQIVLIMDQDQRIILKKMSLEKGRDLAQTYITEGLRSYDEAIDLSTDCEKADARPRVKTFAQKQLRLLKEQRSLIRWIALKKGYAS